MAAGLPEGPEGEKQERGDIQSEEMALTNM